MYLLGVDFGGGASKATLLREDGVVTAVNTVEYRTIYRNKVMRNKIPPTGIRQSKKTSWLL